MGVARGAELRHHAGGLAPRHAPVDVLPYASADSFATWLKAHPSVELITRVRARAFADGAASGAPNAIQIADRWHIIVRRIGAYSIPFGERKG